SGDTDAPRGIQKLRVLAFAPGHRRDDRLLPHQELLVDIGGVDLFLDLADAGEHAEHAAHPAHAAKLAELAREVVEIELPLRELGGEALGLFLVGGLGGLLDQADDIAHAEDAAGDAAGMERLQRLDLFAGADKDDRLAGDVAHRQGRAAARVAIGAGQDDAGEAGAVRERLGDVDRVLAGHRVGDEQGLVRRRRVANGGDLDHQLLVDVEPARRVEQDYVVAFGAADLHGPLGDLDRALALDDRQRVDLDLAAELGELLLRR